MNFRMKLRIPVLAVAALFCCLSCVETNSTLGGNLVPTTETYTLYYAEVPIDGISMQMADKLSGYSDSRITIGAIQDPQYGVTTRASAVTLIPVFEKGKFNLGTNPRFQRFHFATSRDTLCFIDKSQESILQSVRVYELSKALDPEEDSDCNAPIAHGDKLITKGIPVYGGTDSLSFDFTEEFGKKYLQITADDVKDMKTYLAKFPGIYLETDAPESGSGRINMLDVQLSYDANYTSVMGNYATLNYSAEFNGVRKDTSLIFWYGATDFFDMDSLFNSYTGTFPQYALNQTGQQTREKAGVATDKIWIEGGGGLKPVISAIGLKRKVEEVISKAGGDPRNAIINKATLVFPFDFPDNYEEMSQWPYRLSPTCRFVSEDKDGKTTTTFMGLTDSSSSDENQGDVDRSHLRYAPDITYHMQEIVKIDETQTDKPNTKNLLKGNYDIWLLVMALEEELKVSTTSQETQEMLNYLAYSSYYNSMYGGYGGYGGYGYGSGYGSYYSNYLNYAMMAQMASQAQTSTTYSVELDINRFYQAKLHGPQAAKDVPTLQLVFALPNDR